VVGAVGRGVGETFGGATGSKDTGKAIGNLGNSVEDGTANVAQSTKDAGQWKT